jgi:hypothetical protein
MVLLDHRVMEYQFCMQNIQNPKGHYMEFGVFEGKSINYLASLNKKVTFHGFDSFEGLPEQWFMGHKVIEKGHFAVSELPQVVPNVVLHEGWFEDTIPTWKKDHTGHISFINIDCDLYKSTQTILSLLNDQIVSGTLLRFDDLLPSHISPYPKWEEGEWKALSEWCLKFKRKVIPMARSWKQGCIMKVDV